MLRSTLLAGIASLALMAAAPVWAQEAGPNADVNEGDDTSPGTVTNNSLLDNQTLRDNDIVDSYTDATGVVHATQNNGNANSINTATAVQADLDTGIPPLFAGAGVNSNTNSNFVDALGEDDPAAPDRSNSVTGSFGTFGAGQNFAGVASVIQNNGDANEIGVATAVLAVRGTQVGNVSQSSNVNGNTNNNFGFSSGAILDESQVRSNDVTDSFNGAAGTTTTVQNNGSTNAIGTATTVISHEGTTGFYSSGSTVNGQSTANVILDNSTQRSNDVNNSYNNAAGSMNTIQNNGDANTIGSAATVAVGIDPESPLGTLGQASFAALGSLVANNDIQSVNPDASNSNIIQASYTGAAGLMQTTQNNGSGNVIGSAVSVAITLTP